MNKSTYLQDFDLDSKIRAEIGRKTARKIQQVEKELEWEKEKHRLGLAKLQNRQDPYFLQVKGFENMYLNEFVHSGLIKVVR